MNNQQEESGSTKQHMEVEGTDLGVEEQRREESEVEEEEQQREEPYITPDKSSLGESRTTRPAPRGFLSHRQK